MKSQRIGVLLINLGTPDSTEVADVRRYLREFLSDPRVVDINPVGRWLLLNLIILPFRPKASAAAYRKIWTEEGSPLLVYGQQLTRLVEERLGDKFVVRLAMRYQNPSIRSQFEELIAADVDRLIVFPLFPQYSSAATGSALDKVYEVAAEPWNVPSIQTVPPFYEEPGFIQAFAKVSGPVIESFRPDHVLFSYHGLPERHVEKGDPTGAHCLKKDTCCDQIGPANRHCYRAQCFATTRALVEAISVESYSVSFQSRLGRAPWIGPYTDHVLPELAEKGVKRLAVFSPAFVADCLETLEELAIQAKEQWIELGGEDLQLIPSLNADPSWADAVADMVRRYS